MEFRPTTGNAGTGKCQRGAFEHGCEFAPVAGTDTIYIEILSAPCRFYVASVVDGQCSAPVKATERCEHHNIMQIMPQPAIPLCIPSGYNGSMKKGYLYLKQGEKVCNTDILTMRKENM